MVSPGLHQTDLVSEYRGWKGYLPGRGGFLEGYPCKQAAYSHIYRAEGMEGEDSFAFQAGSAKGREK